MKFVACSINAANSITARQQWVGFVYLHCLLPTILCLMLEVISSVVGYKVVGCVPHLKMGPGGLKIIEDGGAMFGQCVAFFTLCL